MSMLKPSEESGCAEEGRGQVESSLQSFKGSERKTPALACRTEVQPLIDRRASIFILHLVNFDPCSIFAHGDLFAIARRSSYQTLFAGLQSLPLAPEHNAFLSPNPPRRFRRQSTWRAIKSSGSTLSHVLNFSQNLPDHDTPD